MVEKNPVTSRVPDIAGAVTFATLSAVPFETSLLSIRTLRCSETVLQRWLSLSEGWSRGFLSGVFPVAPSVRTLVRQSA